MKDERNAADIDGTASNDDADRDVLDNDDLTDDELEEDHDGTVGPDAE